MTGGRARRTMGLGKRDRECRQTAKSRAGTDQMAPTLPVIGSTMPLM